MSPKDRPDVVIFPPYLFGICFVYGVVAHRVCPYRPGWPIAARAAGVVLVLLGIALVQWGKRTMESSGTNVRPDEPSHTIVQSGPFARTRNPLYLGVMGMFAGIGVALGSPAFLTALVPVYVVLRYGVVAREERYLEAKFGDVYLAYKGRVRRWV